MANELNGPIWRLLDELEPEELDDDDDLEHSGVKGMKWGVRKSRSAKYKERAQKGRKATTKALAKNGAKKLSEMVKARREARALVKASKANSQSSPTLKNKENGLSKRGEMIRNRALKLGAKEGAIRKAMPYLTNDEIRRQIERRKLQAEYEELTGGTRTPNRENSLGAKLWDATKSGVASGVKSSIDKGLSEQGSKALSSALSPSAAFIGKTVADASYKKLAEQFGTDSEAVKAAAQAAKSVFDSSKAPKPKNTESSGSGSDNGDKQAPKKAAEKAASILREAVKEEKAKSSESSIDEKVKRARERWGAD